jgi:hypothetical protein
MTTANAHTGYRLLIALPPLGGTPCLTTGISRILMTVRECWLRLIVGWLGVVSLLFHL